MSELKYNNESDSDSVSDSDNNSDYQKEIAEDKRLFKEDQKKYRKEQLLEYINEDDRLKIKNYLLEVSNMKFNDEEFDNAKIDHENDIVGTKEEEKERIYLKVKLPFYGFRHKNFICNGTYIIESSPLNFVHIVTNKKVTDLSKKNYRYIVMEGNFITGTEDEILLFIEQNLWYFNKYVNFEKLEEYKLRRNDKIYSIYSYYDHNWNIRSFLGKEYAINYAKMKRLEADISIPWYKKRIEELNERIEQFTEDIEIEHKNDKEYGEYIKLMKRK